jgi:hypothetical protein
VHIKVDLVLQQKEDPEEVLEMEVHLEESLQPSTIDALLLAAALGNQDSALLSQIMELVYQ